MYTQRAILGMLVISAWLMMPDIAWAQSYPVPPYSGKAMYRRHEDPIPKTFPVASYPGSKASDAYTQDDVICLSLLTSDPVPKVYKWYVAFARSRGWKVYSDYCPEDCSNATLGLTDNRGKTINIGLFHDELTEIGIDYKK